MRKHAFIAVVAVVLGLAVPAAHAFDWIGKIALDAEGLKSPDVTKRRTAATRLAQYDISLVKGYLLSALRDNDAKVRETAARALAEHKVKVAVPIIITWLNAITSDEQQLAAELLGKIGSVKAVPALIRSLSALDFKVRLSVVTALGTIGSKSVVVPLVGRLDDDKSEVREEAVKQLQAIGDRRAVIPLVNAFGDSSVKVRIAAIEAVGHLGVTSPVPALLRLLREPLDKIKQAAVRSLGNLHAIEAVEPLISALGRGSYGLRAEVAYALGKIAKHARPNAAHSRTNALRALVKATANSGMRKAAAEALRNAGRVAVPVIIDHLEGKLPGDPKTAVALLRDIGDPRATKALITELDRGRIERDVLLDALSKSGDKRALVPILGLLSSKDSAVRLKAMRALRPLLMGSAHDARAADVLVGMLKDKSVQVRILAAEYLGLMRSKAAVPQLIGLASAKQKLSMRRAAVAALGEVADPRDTNLLLNVLASGPRQLWRPAANALIYIGAKSSVAKLMAIAANEHAAGRFHAVRALGGVLRDKPNETVRVLLEKLASDGGTNLSLAAIAALGAMRAPDSRAMLLALARSHSPSRRRAAITALGNFSDADAVPVLMRALQTSDDRVSGAAAWALGKRKASAALDQLFRITRRRGWVTAINASAAVAYFAGADHTDQLLGLLHHRIRLVRANAAAALGRLHAQRARKTLSRLLEHDGSWLVRLAAARALSQLGGAKAVLKKAAEHDQHKRVREAIGKLLKHPFSPPRRSDWRNFVFVDPHNPNSVVRNQPYFIAAADGIVTAFYTDERGEAAEERFPPGHYEITPKSRVRLY